MENAKKKRGAPVRVLGDRASQEQVLQEFHESLWAGHRGVWGTFAKIKEKYWWQNMYKDVEHYVETCSVCQMYSMVTHRDGLHPTYPLSMHYKWVVDLVTIPTGLWSMRYLVLAREDLTNQVEGRALSVEMTSSTHADIDDGPPG